MEVKKFDSGDEPFLEWMDEHPEGYVLNVKRKSSSGFGVTRLFPASKTVKFATFEGHSYHLNRTLLATFSG